LIKIEHIEFKKLLVLHVALQL